ncbi:hypothetical protein AURDEDRAFT_187580 [Auricularia subglabra TFB-10046 SS5]|nr:hypothetical protein AURDEDRAFT_187580 [Auricularia subglabra TFB-10046 SS5]
MASTHPAPAQDSSSRVDDVLAASESVARLLSAASTGTGIPGLEAAGGAVLSIISHIKRVRDNSSECKDVARQIASLTGVLKDATESIDARIRAENAPAHVKEQLGSSENMKKRITQLQERLGDILTDAKKLQKQSKLRRVVMANRNTDILKGISGSLKEARDDFMITANIAMEIVLQEIASEVRASAERRKIEELRSAIEKLNPVLDASYRSSIHARHGRLLDGTRVDLLRDLTDWAQCLRPAESEETEDKPFFVLHGGAGTGKSTVAYEFAQREEAAGRLGASFFFMRGSDSLSSTVRFFPTLAAQLINHIPELRATALPLLNEHLGHGGSQNMDVQGKDLFKGLLSGLPSDRDPPIVIVVDAVDECTESSQDLVPRMLYLMKDALSSISCRVRVFVTSRPEVHITDAFQSPRFATGLEKVRLQDIPPSVVDADIRLFFSHTLRNDISDGARLAIGPQLPGVVEELTELASGLFIYASTAMHFLKGFRRAEIFEGLTLLRATGAGRLGRLDALYTTVLSAALTPDLLARKERDVRVILGCIVVLRDHVSPNTLARFLGLRLDLAVLPILDRLQAIISFEPNDPDVPIRPLHASFGEFLVDPARCSNAAFLVDPSRQHAFFAQKCISSLLRPETLVRNICRLSDPCIPRSRIPDLAARLKRLLPEHGDQKIESLLSEFCSSKLLEWLEALAFLDGLSHAIHWLPTSQRSSLLSNSTAELLHDAFRICAEFSPAITLCPEQLYLSCLAFTPSCSTLRNVYASVLEESATLRCLGQAINAWDHSIDIVVNGSPGLTSRGISQVFSAPHGRWVAVDAPGNYAIHLCRPDTGELVQSVHAPALSSGHRQIRFSMAGFRMAFTADDRVYVISTRSGAVLHELPLDGIPMCAFFIRKEKALLVAVRARRSTGRRVLIWELETQAITELPGLAEHADGIADASSDGRWALSILNGDGYVVDLTSLTVTRRFENTSEPARFIPRSDALVLPRNGSLCVCDLATGDVLHDLKIRTNQSTRVVISRDGQTIVAFSPHMKRTLIHVWTTEVGLRTFSGRGFFPTDVSLDGKRIICLLVTSLAWRLIDIDEGLPEAETGLETPAEDPVAVRIAPDGSSYAVATAQSLKLYDRTTELIRSIPLSAEEAAQVRQTAQRDPVGLAVCHDSRLVAVLLYDHVVLCDGDGVHEQSLALPKEVLTDVLERESVFTSSSQYFASTRFTSAVFTPDERRLIAFVQLHIADLKDRIIKSTLHAAISWDVATSTVAAVYRVPVGTRWSAIHRCCVVSPDTLHFEVTDWQQNTTTFSARLPEHAQESPLEVSKTASMPGDKFSVSRDGWITRVDSPRNLCWLPHSRRPSPLRFRSCQHISGEMIAAVADSGLLTVVDMSRDDEFDGSAWLPRDLT